MDRQGLTVRLVRVTLGPPAPHHHFLRALSEWFSVREGQRLSRRWRNVARRGLSPGFRWQDVSVGPLCLPGWHRADWLADLRPRAQGHRGSAGVARRRASRGKARMMFALARLARKALTSGSDDSRFLDDFPLWLRSNAGRPTATLSAYWVQLVALLTLFWSFWLQVMTRLAFAVTRRSKALPK